MRNGQGVGIVLRAHWIVEGVIQHALLRRTHNDAGVDRGFQQLAADESSQIVAPFGKIFGGKERTILG